MRLRFVGKAIFVTILLLSSTILFFYASFLLIFALNWGQRGLGALMIAMGLRGFVWAFDLMWERPARWSKEPWRREWEDSGDTMR